MKIFGINFTTKKELKEQVVGLTREAAELYEDLKYLRNDFPFDLGDIASSESRRY